MKSNKLDQDKFIAQCLEDIIANGEKIARIVKESKDHFVNEDLQAAVERYFEIIGEAAKRLPDEFRDKHNNQPWRQIIGIRNVIIHKYDVVDPKELLLTAHYTLPSLVAYTKKIIAEISSN